MCDYLLATWPKLTEQICYHMPPTLTSPKRLNQAKLLHVCFLPWFRVHIVILNDLGRLISSHALYELITIDPTSNLIWTYEK